MSDVERVTITPSAETTDPALPSDQPQGADKLLAGKFKTAEELEKGYKELEKKLGSKPKGEPKPEPTPEPKPTDSKDALKIEKAAEEAVTNAGLDMEAFSKEFETTGELSQESFEKLEKAGIPKAMVEAYIEGQKAVAEGIVNRVKGYAGGEESYAAMIDWAAKNYTPEEIQVFNEAISGNAASQKLAVESLSARYSKEVGSDPKLLKGGTAATSSAGYGSRQEMMTDMKDPRYNRDPAFRAKVQEKLARTTAF